MFRLVGGKQEPGRNGKKSGVQINIEDKSLRYKLGLLELRKLSDVTHSSECLAADVCQHLLDIIQVVLNFYCSHMKICLQVHLKKLQYNQKLISLIQFK